VGLQLLAESVELLLQLDHIGAWEKTQALKLALGDDASPIVTAFTGPQRSTVDTRAHRLVGHAAGLGGFADREGLHGAIFVAG